jgi:hypothetical protein
MDWGIIVRFSGFSGPICFCSVHTSPDRRYVFYLLTFFNFTGHKRPQAFLGLDALVGCFRYPPNIHARIFCCFGNHPANPDLADVNASGGQEKPGILEGTALLVAFPNWTAAFLWVAVFLFTNHDGE